MAYGIRVQNTSHDNNEPHTYSCQQIRFRKHKGLNLRAERKRERKNIRGNTLDKTRTQILFTYVEYTQYYTTHVQ